MRTKMTSRQAKACAAYAFGIVLCVLGLGFVQSVAFWAVEPSLIDKDLETVVAPATSYAIFGLGLMAGGAILVQSVCRMAPAGAVEMLADVGIIGVGSVSLGVAGVMFERTGIGALHIVCVALGAVGLTFAVMGAWRLAKAIHESHGTRRRAS